MDWKELRERLDKQLEECASFPTDEKEQLIAKVWYWRGIANYAKLMNEEKGGQDEQHKDND